MATIVAAMAMTHSPGLTGLFERAPMHQQLLAKKAMDEMRWRLEAAKPDAILAFSMQQVDIYGQRDRLTWTPRADQWMRFETATLK